VTDQGYQGPDEMVGEYADVLFKPDSNVSHLTTVTSSESLSQSISPNINLNHHNISNVIVARDINLADSLVQIQALEVG